MGLAAILAPTDSQRVREGTGFSTYLRPIDNMAYLPLFSLTDVLMRGYYQLHSQLDVPCNSAQMERGRRTLEPVLHLTK